MTDKPDFVALHAEVKSIGDDDEFPGRFEVIASTKALDRDGESVRHGALTLPQSAPFYVDHDWKSGALPIGRGVPVYADGVMKAEGSYASTPRAQEIRTLVREKIIDSCSIGFMNGKRETTKGLREVVSGDLFEISFTALPINTEARVLAAKALMSPAEIRAAEAVALRATKAIEGSHEALRDRLCAALDDAYGEYGCWIRGVMPDAVIFETGSDTFSQAYEDDGTAATLIGARSEVEIHEVVAASALDDASTLSLQNSEGAADPAAKAAGSAVTDEAEQAAARFASARFLT